MSARSRMYLVTQKHLPTSPRQLNPLGSELCCVGTRHEISLVRSEKSRYYAKFSDEGLPQAFDSSILISLDETANLLEGL